ncbi:nuclear envelope protein Brr6, putative [Talaromyces stipitatus ATCC 10500]|uniref:Nuclear envelope protein Brr6, putative n=1 Tax=Talaromyces stipitatus (strain ATCC 10500 / CBS 375.48 / QM 6759 / NRRL 1006) TaxID=441959 RepID=B8MP60_TALSN|nr:nuclear envelope protein Brr6, putative [Talaromyces stipitatus ATCC 10500]EED14299.1 nuclear envelope protein Brr6, putative [Talaromyces stipitatus ATCC 10500]
MERRTAESPMDFEWQTRAPGDITSPFYQLGLQHDNQKKSFVFDSPLKKQSAPTQSFNFSQPSPQRNGSPNRPDAIFGKSSFQTPRKFDLDFSSGAENMSSPENADNEGTPESIQVNKNERRNSLFRFYGRFAPSPGRGEIPRVTNHKTDHARRIHKRKIRDRDINRHLRRDSDYDSDRPSSREEAQQLSKFETKKFEQTPSPSLPPQGSTWAHFFAFLDEHPNLPAILSYWLQLVWNLVLFSLVTWVVVSFVLTIKQDIDHAADAKRNDILTEISTCKEFYIQNSCNLASRPPALNEVCNNWERCMDQDPNRVARATVSVQTISAIITGFVDAISFKAFSYFLLTITTITIASNWSFIALRHQYTKKEDRRPYPNSQHPQGQPSYQHRQAPPVSYAADGNQYPLEYPKTPGRGEESPSRRQRNYQDDDEDNDRQSRRLLLENTPSRDMAFVTGRSRERELHARTPSPSKRERWM